MRGLVLGHNFFGPHTHHLALLRWYLPSLFFLSVLCIKKWLREGHIQTWGAIRGPN